MNITFKLQTDSIMQVPLRNYENNFTFIINGDQFETNKIIADLISPYISKIHASDPTLSEFTITTQEKGNFQIILDLFSFKEFPIKENEIKFISEIFEKLGTDNLSIKSNSSEINIDNVIYLIRQHEKSHFLFSQNLKQEIDFLSEHFYELNENQEKQLMNLSIQTIEKIFYNSNLKLKTEDQLLRVIDQLYIENHNYSYLYQYVLFSNVETKSIEEFLSIFDNDNLTRGTWLSLSKRLINDIEKVDYRYHSKNKIECKEKNKVKSVVEIPFSNGKLEGIFSFLLNNSIIKNEVKITCSYHCGGSISDLIEIEKTNNRFYTNYSTDPWLCFEFKKRKIVPSNYSIRSQNCNANGRHPKSWYIEGSEDGKNWIKIDEQVNCPYLNGPNIVHTFPIQKEKFEGKAFKFIRMHHTDKSWGNFDSIIDICSIEFYGKLI